MPNHIDDIVGNVNAHCHTDRNVEDTSLFNPIDPAAGFV
jgi:hypothetical protein